MSDTILHDPLAKRLLRSCWSLALGGHAFLSVPFSGSGSVPRVYYGGARPGDIGGPLVKIKRLKNRFPEHRWLFNVVYVLSNAPYLPTSALKNFKNRGIPMVHNQNGVFYQAWYAGDWHAQNATMARSYHLADHVFYQSAFCQTAANKFLGQREGAGEILYNAVDTSLFSPDLNRARDSSVFRFLITGKIDDHLFYRLESTIRGLALARKQGLDATLEIAGWIGDNARRATQELAKDLNVETAVVLSGPYRQEEAPAVYQRADAYVMTKHNDPCPNTVLEAMASGLPTLYSNTGGVPELVAACGVPLACEESWEVPKVPEANAIAEGMLKIAESQSILAEASRDRAVAKFDIGPWLGRHDTVFRQLIGSL